MRVPQIRNPQLSLSFMTDLRIVTATERDIPRIVWFIRQLAEYERLSHQAVVTEELIRESLFGERPVAEVVFGYHRDEPVAFAVFFHFRSSAQ